MNTSRAMRPRRVLAMMAMFFGMMVMTLIPAYGQQEVDPTWYDPWGAPKTEVAQSSKQTSKPRVAAQRQHAKVKAVSMTRVAGKTRGKQSKTPTRPS